MTFIRDLELVVGFCKKIVTKKLGQNTVGFFRKTTHLFESIKKQTNYRRNLIQLPSCSKDNTSFIGGARDKVITSFGLSF